MIYKGVNRVTSGFQLPDRPSHNGIDIVGDTDQAVRAAVAGTVVFAGAVADKATGGLTWQWGNYVRVDGAGVRTYYCHMAAGSLRVKRGDPVSVGTPLGTMGNTGYSFGAHLHFEVRNGAGRAINPAPYAGVQNAKGKYTEK